MEENRILSVHLHIDIQVLYSRTVYASEKSYFPFSYMPWSVTYKSLFSFWTFTDILLFMRVFSYFYLVVTRTLCVWLIVELIWMWRANKIFLNTWIMSIDNYVQIIKSNGLPYFVPCILFPSFLLCRSIKKLWDGNIYFNVPFYFLQHV